MEGPLAHKSTSGSLLDASFWLLTNQKGSFRHYLFMCFNQIKFWKHAWKNFYLWCSFQGILLLEWNSGKWRDSWSFLYMKTWTMRNLIVAWKLNISSSLWKEQLLLCTQMFSPLVLSFVHHKYIIFIQSFIVSSNMRASCSRSQRMKNKKLIFHIVNISFHSRIVFDRWRKFCNNCLAFTFCTSFHLYKFSI